MTEVGHINLKSKVKRFGVDFLLLLYFMYFMSNIRALTLKGKRRYEMERQLGGRE